MSEHGTAELVEHPAGAPGTDRRSRRARSVALAAGVAAAGLLTLSGADAGAGPALAGVALTGPGGQPVAFGGSRVSCGGVWINTAELPGRTIGEAERSGPAEGISQVLRLSEWTRTTPYDGVRWSTVNGATADTALLVATTPRRATRYVPLHRGPDGHWQIDAPCELRSR
ncbi:MAG TPA: hypothetical protein VMU51_13300 [Mycobacteriales bacterium]|nr:hypothetical protein [Mycobacteriales bacterium]